MRSEKLIVALDMSSDTEAKALVRQLKKDVSIFKIGLQLFTVGGPAVVKAIQKGDHKVFLDLKYHDIPNTIAKAVTEATRLGVFMMTLHALGGKEMMERAVDAAREAAEKLSLKKPNLVAVTIPTSRQEIAEVGIGSTVLDEVLRLTELARDAGCDGVVCSPQEIGAIRRIVPESFLIVAPGIRLGGEEEDDQKRISTPKAAIDAGANYIVVGRPILRAADPSLAVRRINASLHGVDIPLTPEELVASSEEASEEAREEVKEEVSETIPEEKPVEPGIIVAPARDEGPASPKEDVPPKEEPVPASFAEAPPIEMPPDASPDTSEQAPETPPVPAPEPEKPLSPLAQALAAALSKGKKV